MVAYIVDDNNWTTSTYYNNGTSSGDNTCIYIDSFDYGWASTYTCTEELILPILFTKNSYWYRGPKIINSKPVKINKTQKFYFRRLLPSKSGWLPRKCKQK